MPASLAAHPGSHDDQNDAGHQVVASLQGMRTPQFTCLAKKLKCPSTWGSKQYAQIDWQLTQAPTMTRMTLGTKLWMRASLRYVDSRCLQDTANSRQQSRQHSRQAAGGSTSGGSHSSQANAGVCKLEVRGQPLLAGIGNSKQALQAVWEAGTQRGGLRKHTGAGSFCLQEDMLQGDALQVSWGTCKRWVHNALARNHGDRARNAAAAKQCKAAVYGEHLLLLLANAP